MMIVIVLIIIVVVVVINIVIIIDIIVVIIIVIIIVIHTITKGVVWCGVVGRGGGQQQAHNFLISPIAKTQHSTITTSSSHELVLNGRQPRTRPIKFVLAPLEPVAHRLYRHYFCSSVILLQERWIFFEKRTKKGGHTNIRRTTSLEKIPRKGPLWIVLASLNSFSHPPHILLVAIWCILTTGTSKN